MGRKRLRFEKEGDFFRVFAKESFRNHNEVIAAGTKGGLVKSPNNISTSKKSSAWITENATVKDNALILGDALIAGFSTVKGCSVISDQAIVRDYAVVENGKVSDLAIISGNAFVSGIVCDNSDITDSGKVLNKGVVYGNSLVVGTVDGAHIINSTIKKDSRVKGNVLLERTVVKNTEIINTNKDFKVVIKNGLINKKEKYVFLPNLRFLKNSSLCFFETLNGWEYSHFCKETGNTTFGKLSDLENIYKFADDSIFSNIFKINKSNTGGIGKDLYFNFLNMVSTKVSNITNKPWSLATKHFGPILIMVFNVLALNCMYIYQNRESFSDTDQDHATRFIESCDVDFSKNTISSVGNAVLCNKKILLPFLEEILDKEDARKVLSEMKKNKDYIAIQL